MKAKFLLMLVAACMVSAPVSGIAATKQDNKVNAATDVLQKFSEIPETNIPPQLMRQAFGVAVLPNVIKAGLSVGGRYGRGLLTIRDAQGNWSNPTFISLAGGSFGLQAGIQSTDIILVFKSRRSIDNITGGKLTLGADASVAAGPVGRHGSAATDLRFQAEVYSYSRSRGLFAGVALEGAALTIQNKWNSEFYGKYVTPDEIFAGLDIDLPAPAQAFISKLNDFTPDVVEARVVTDTSAPDEDSSFTTYPVAQPEAVSEAVEE